MASLEDAALLMVVLLGASALGLLVRPLLSERHRSRETAEIMQLVATMLVTFAALVLGLLITSSKASFDSIDTDVRGYASELTELNRLLREYGPDTAPIRQALRSYTAAAIASTWTEEKPPPGDYYPKTVRRAATDVTLESSGLGETLAQIELHLRELAPTDAMHRRLLDDCLNQFDRLLDQRWKLIEEVHSSISLPFYLVLVFWLAIVFGSFGLSAPRNALSYTMILLGSLAIASAVFVILDLDTPFTGSLVVSSQPMRDALAHLSQ
jgi:hypothetical protein